MNETSPTSQDNHTRISVLEGKVNVILITNFVNFAVIIAVLISMVGK